MNNIGCEELVGLFSAIKERAPNGSLLFYSAKIKAKNHCTISEARDTVIKRSIKLAMSM